MVCSDVASRNILLQTLISTVTDIFWYYPAINASFSRFNSTSKVDFPFMYQKRFPGSFCNFAISVRKTVGQICTYYPLK